MGSITESEEEETNTQRVLNSDLSDEEEETQIINTDEFESTLRIDDTVDTVKIEETQELDDPDCETQLLLDSDGEGDGGQGSDRTEVLSDDEERSDGDCGKGGGVAEVEVELEKRCSEEEEKGFVADSEGSSGEKGGSGSVRRSFLSVRAASLRTSGLAATRRMSCTESGIDLSSAEGNGQAMKELGHKDNTVTGVKDSAKFDGDLVTENCNGSVEGIRDDDKHRAVSSTVRRLFAEDAVPSNIVSTDGNDITEGTDLTDPVARDHEVAGLSYVVSQEPGELSQENALNMIDKFLSVNDMELFEEPNLVKITKKKSPPLSTAKGAQVLAQRAKVGSPVGQIGIFDWDDSREDERGGDFFSNKKEVLLGSDAHVRGSLTHPDKPKKLSRKESHTINKLEMGKEGLKLHQKILGLTRFDSRLKVLNSKEDDKLLQPSKRKTRKGLFEVDKQLNAKTSELQLEATGINKDSLNICDGGIDTQVAADDIDVLVSGGFAKHTTPSTTEDLSGGVTGKKACMKQASIQRRNSASVGVSTRSKKRKILSTDLGGETLITALQESKIRTMQELLSNSRHTGQKRNSVTEQDLISGKATDENNCSGKGSSKSANKIKGLSALEANVREVEALNGEVSFGQGQTHKNYVNLTPVARRTRQSSSVNPSKKSEGEIFLNETRKDANGPGEATGKKRRRRNSGDDAPKPSNRARKISTLSSNQSGDISKKKLSEQEALDHEPQEEIATDNHVNADVSSYSRRRTVRRNMSGNLNEVTNLEAPPTIVETIEVNKGKSITRQTESNVDTKCTVFKFDMRRKTRSSVRCHPSSSPSEKKSEESKKKQDVVEPSLAEPVNCSIAVVKVKTAPKDPVHEKVPKRPGRNCVSNSLSSARAVEVDAGSPAEKVKPSGSTCVSPVNCTTPINAASPVCIGDDYHKQSCKRSLSRSSVMRELVHLDITEALHTSPLKDLRKRKDMSQVRVLFSHHLDEDITKQQKKILARLGASVACSPSEATHFITDKFVRTRNMLEAIAHGKPVVTHFWLESCGQANCLIDEWKHILRDFKKEKEIGFSMPDSLANASQSPLLKNRRVFITPNVKPSKEVITSLVKAVDGMALERLGRSVINADNVADDLLVLSCEEDYEICVPLLEKGAMIYSSELLLNGIVIQKLEYGRHRLFTDHVRRTRSTIWLRKDGDLFHPVTKRK